MAGWSSAFGQKGDTGATGPAGAAGGGAVFIQQTEPDAASPYIWFKTNAQGEVIDILKG